MPSRGPGRRPPTPVTLADTPHMDMPSPSDAAVTPPPAPPPAEPPGPSVVPVPPPVPPTPRLWRLLILAGVLAVGAGAYLGRDIIGLRGQSAAGILFFFGIVAAFSANLRAVNWRTIGWGIALQVVLAVLVLRGKWTINGTEYSVYA